MKDVKTSATRKYMTVMHLALFASLSLNGCGSRVEFSLRNNSNSSLDSVTVHVTGENYHIGSLPPHASTNIRVSPKSDSHIEIQYKKDGVMYRRVIDCYLEPHCSGKVDATLHSNGEISYSSDIDP